MKLTNKQHIELLDTFIEKNTDYKSNEFTGGSVSNTLTHNNTQIHYKVNLYFGYKNKRPITKTIAINEDIYSIMYKAITLKIKSMLIKDDVFSLKDIESLINTPSSTPSSNTPPPTPTNTITYYLTTIDTNTIDTNTFEMWLKYKKYDSIQGVTLSANFLSNYSKEIQKQIVDASIMNGWKGLFAPKGKMELNKSLDQKNEEFLNNYFGNNNDAIDTEVAQ